MLKKIPWISLGGIFLALCFLYAAISPLIISRVDARFVDTTPQERPVIVLDAGHGGIDGGAMGADGTVEKEINLAVSKRLAALFRLMGYEVIETRTDDRSLADADAPKGHVKQSDLINRLKISEAYPSGVLISIHMNAYRGVDCQGLQVWYSENNAASKELADAVQGEVKELLQPENNRKIKAATSSIYLLRHATSPAILIECGFISTASECEKLTNDHYQKQLALAIFAALHKKIGNGTCGN